MKEKADFTLQRLLDEVLYKEHLQALLEEYGESPSGQKPELIERFLNSERIHRRSVDEVVREILKEVPAADLRDLGRRLNIELPAKKKEMVRCLMNGVNFEPYTKEVERYCSVCKARTMHRLHFKMNWQANYFQCQICHSQVDASKPPSTADNRVDASGGEPRVSSDTLRKTTPETKEDLGPALERAVREQATSKILLDTIEAHRQMEIETQKQTLASTERMLTVEGLRRREEGRRYESLASKVNRGTIWTIIGVLVALGALVPTLMAWVLDGIDARALALAATPFLLIALSLFIYLLRTRKAAGKM